MAVWIAAYLLGSVSSAIITCRLLGYPDPRQSGSGNPGATNVLRVGGRGAAAITLLFDVSKGLIPVLIVRALEKPESVAIIAGFFAFIGHLYPVFFQFRGGKGVATALGVLAAVHWPLMIVVAAIWLFLLKRSRISSLASIVSFSLAPMLTLLLLPREFNTVLMLAILLIASHHQNILALIKGEEQPWSRSD